MSVRSLERERDGDNMSVETKKEEPKPMLNQEEIDKYLNLEWEEKSRLNLYGESRTKVENTVAALEEELKSTASLKCFIEQGVLVNDQIILSAKPDDFRHNMSIRVLGQTEGSITVELNVKDAERLERLIPAMIKAAQKLREIKQLKELIKKDSGRRF